MNAAAAGATSRGRRQNWLLLFNCQAEGLANSLELLGVDLRVESHHPPSFRKLRDDIAARLDEFDRIVVAPRVEPMLGFDLRGRDDVIRVPHVRFHGFHPDLVYMGASSGLAKGAIGEFHSALVYAAFRSGLDEAAAAALFREDVFAELGYLDSWQVCREQLERDFSEQDFDVRESFVRWSRTGAFMHTINHPKIGVLADVARLVLRRAGIEPREAGMVPHDGLAKGPVFPVFPPIGARLGIRGSYLFKQGGGYAVLDLDEYVAASYRIYREAVGAKPANKSFLPVIERAESLVRAMR